jgi:hypothetical protein
VFYLADISGGIGLTNIDGQHGNLYLCHDGVFFSINSQSTVNFSGWRPVAPL